MKNFPEDINFPSRCKYLRIYRTNFPFLLHGDFRPIVVSAESAREIDGLTPRRSPSGAIGSVS